MDDVNPHANPIIIEGEVITIKKNNPSIKEQKPVNNEFIIETKNGTNKKRKDGRINCLTKLFFSSFFNKEIIYKPDTKVKRTELATENS